MISFRAFETLTSIITGSREREAREHDVFLQFYQALVKIIDDETAKEFGSIEVPTLIKGKLADGYRLELTVTDYLWWKTIIHDDKGRFVNGVSAVQRDIWDRMTKLVRDNTMSAEERTKLMELMVSDEVSG
jgi:hypothetical protein